MSISRRGFLKGLAGTSIFAATAGKISTAKAAVKSYFSDDEAVLMRYWELKDYLGSAEYDRRVGINGKEIKALWYEYYDLVDMLGALGGEPRVRKILGKLVIVDSNQPTGKYTGQKWPYRSYDGSK